jgi:hypothetical protein
MEAETVSAASTADGTKAAEETVPQWWASHAREFPYWYVWRGVAGHYYARVPRSSPPIVVRAMTPEDLRDEVMRAELSPWPVASRSQFRNHCA